MFNVPSKLCACTQIMRRAHTRKLGEHTMLPPKMCFAHTSKAYTSFQIQMSSCKMLHKRNYMRTQTLKIRGNIGHVSTSFLVRFQTTVVMIFVFSSSS